MGLNHIYKVIWSKTKCAWVVVSELAKREGKSSVKSMLSANGMRSAVACMVVMALGCGTAMGATEYGVGASGLFDSSTAIGANAEADSEGTAVGYKTSALGNKSSAFGANAQAHVDASAFGANSRSVANGAAFGTEAQALQHGVAVGYKADANSEGVAVGYKAIGGWSGVSVGFESIAVPKSVAIGYESIAMDEYSTAIGYNSKANRPGAVALGGGSEDASRELALDVTIGSTIIPSSAYAANSGGDGSTVSIGKVGEERQLKNVGAGVISATSTDAVNGSQLYAVANAIINTTAGSGAISTESVVAATSTAGDTNLVTVTPQTGTKIGETYAVSVSGNAVKALATQAANQAINATNLNIAGDNTTGSVNVGTGVLKVAGSNGVETVANGSTITVGLDAATRNKIDNAATNAANGANKDLSNISPAGQQVIKDTAAWNMKVNGNAAETIKGGDTVTFNNGNNIEITQVGKDITVATKQDVTFNTITGVSTITGAGAPSISFNNPAGGTPSISVNAPIDMNGKTITNLADGVNPTDAVNKQQLDNAIMSVGGNPGLNDRVNKLSNRVDKVGAGAAALAALHPLDFNPDDKWNFAAGYGNYAGQNSMALGAFYRPNEDTMFSVSGTMGTGEDMVNAGVSFKLGQSSGVTNSRVAMAQEIKNLKNAVDIVLQQNQTLMKQNQVLAQTVSELSGKPIVSEGNFNDVPANHWAYGYVKALAQQGIIVGYEDGEFKGDRTMTRYELAAVIYRALQSGANIDADMKRAMDEFGPELEALRLADTFRIDRVSGDNNDRHKIDRVRVNNQTGRDVYGNHVQSK